jgi:NIMA (never in mitosis gene a)-related kinase 2
MSSIIAQKESELSGMQQAMHTALDQAVKDAIIKREEELRTLVLRREEEVAALMAKREEEIITSVNQREAELCRAWEIREEQMRQEIEDKVQWVQRREQELIDEEIRLRDAKAALEEKAKKWGDRTIKGADTCPFQLRWLMIGDRRSKRKESSRRDQEYH